METPSFSFIHSARYKWTIAASQGIFFGLFLLLFQPFGVNNYNPHREYTSELLLMVVLVSVLITGQSLVMEFFLKPIFGTAQSLKYLVLWTAATFVVYSQGCFLFYNYSGDWHDLRLSSAIEFVFDCSTVFLFPTVGSITYFLYQHLKNAYTNALTNVESRMSSVDLLSFQGQGTQDKLILSVETFLLVQAQDNYVELSYLDNGKVSKFLMRSSLSNISESISSPVVRVHRSYMVNLYHVYKIQGHGVDARLSVANISEEIPVSKTYHTEVMSELRRLKKFN